MEFKGRFAGISRDWESGVNRLSFDIEEMTEGALLPSVELIKGKTLRVKAVKYREKRSLSANAYAWVLMQRIAEALHTTKDEVYLECLKRYSREFRYIICRPDAVEDIKKICRTVEDMGDIDVGQGHGLQLRVYFGSSTFDTKAMSVFIDGIVSECKDLGIETLTPRELDQMKARWSSEVGND